MARIKVWYRCPTCQKQHNKESDAIACRNNHPILAESWAVGKDGKAVRISDHCAPNGLGGINWALREADLSDNIKIRTRQLEEETDERNER
ncbi:hypothetical protein [Desulfosporosinus sp. OT]|uniref:hypothetical protein n=1 Tax=Desulfosporosinus sp. OT TaxID=913865 RepID=UPI000223A388|nr:hypothetical protein [Desulfosporosinus sp. OT]EGW36481.1 hypothetical protein DOT_5645 [Desulfosporosinus sp. OT]